MDVAFGKLRKRYPQIVELGSLRLWYLSQSHLL